ncbi:MAG: bifunctional diaminohydroxyphosphoribosylaminopyrimidine deaminase/5-amino-6-(5-phosphoribosylamino)uracil reductase RibD [Acidobacteriota bacterium]|nr:bifunctional diaminohydroxyphosphoribosylaminopyrimidine deaminase/5-amino-6-(5-phosphoribosylamino)uracil reductase RibD [Acidobacteriota bacterium]
MPTTVSSLLISGEASELDRRMIARALELSAKGVGLVSPGPLVGCVLVSADGRVIGEGFYVYEEIKHAETVALEQAGKNAAGATAYVSLEPHAHHGRTSPCTDALIAAGIKRVVAPVEDPNPKVSGRGFAHLHAAGLQVSCGLMAREAQQLNEKYFHLMKTGRPFVHLKLATSLDGKIATRTGDSRWITGEPARARVQELRHEYDAILVGAGTATADDPLLTDRSGRPRRRPLVRVVLDDALSLTPQTQLAETAKEFPLLVFTSPNSDANRKSDLEKREVEILSEPSGRDLNGVLAELGNRSLQSVLVEGGSNVAGALLHAGLVDKVSFFIAPRLIGGREAPGAIGDPGVERLSEAVELEDVEIVQLGSDFEITGYPKGRKGDGEKG